MIATHNMYPVKIFSEKCKLTYPGRVVDVAKLLFNWFSAQGCHWERRH